MPNGELSAYLAAQLPQNVASYAGTLGRNSAIAAGVQPAGPGMPTPPALAAAPQMGGAPGVLAPMTMPQAQQVGQMAQGMPAGTPQGLPTGEAGPDQMTLELALMLSGMPFAQAMALIQQIPDPAMQAQVMQLAMVVSPGAAEAAMAGPAQPQVQQTPQNVLASLTPEELLAAGGGVNPLGVA